MSRISAQPPPTDDWAQVRLVPRVGRNCARKVANLSFSKSLSEVSCYLANEAMNRHLRDTVADDRVHGLSRGAEWWFVTAREIQLRFGCGQRVDRKLRLHEREQAWHGRGLPLEQQPSDGS